MSRRCVLVVMGGSVEELVQGDQVWRTEMSCGDVHVAMGCNIEELVQCDGWHRLKVMVDMIACCDGYMDESILTLRVNCPAHMGRWMHP